MLDVLLVEDEAANQAALARVLESGGFRVRVAGDGVMAFNALAQSQFAAIVCDLRMPVLGGRGFFEQLETLDPHMAARVVFITAFADDPKLRSFLAESGQPLLEKPFEPAALIAAVNTVAARIG
jgi:CheY-like chemotaxis protein